MELMNIFAGQQWRHRHREQTYGYSWQGEKERIGGMEKVTWKHTLTYVEWIASGNLLHDSGNSNRGVGKGGSWEGTWVNLWLNCVDIW